LLDDSKELTYKQRHKLKIAMMKASNKPQTDWRQRFAW